MNDHHRSGEWADKVVRDLRKEYVILGKHRVHGWYAWAIIGVVLGLVMGIMYVANLSGEFSSSFAARQTYYAPGAALSLLPAEQVTVLNFSSNGDERYVVRVADINPQDDDVRLFDAQSGGAFSRSGSFNDTDDSTSDSISFRRATGKAVLITANPKNPWPLTSLRSAGSDFVGYRKNLAEKSAAIGTVMTILEKVTLTSAPSTGVLSFTAADEDTEVLVNNRSVYKSTNKDLLRTATTLDITKELKKGDNVIKFRSRKTHLGRMGVRFIGTIAVPGAGSATAQSVLNGTGGVVLAQATILGVDEPLVLESLGVKMVKTGGKSWGAYPVADDLNPVQLIDATRGTTLAQLGSCSASTVNIVNCKLTLTSAGSNGIASASVGTPIEIQLKGSVRSTNDNNSVQVSLVPSEKTLRAKTTRKYFTFPAVTGGKIVFASVSPSATPSPSPTPSPTPGTPPASSPTPQPTPSPSPTPSGSSGSGIVPSDSRTPADSASGASGGTGGTSATPTPPPPSPAPSPVPVSAGTATFPSYPTCAEQNTWYTANRSTYKIKLENGTFACPSDRSDLVTAFMMYDRISQASSKFKSKVPYGQDFGRFLTDSTTGIYKDGPSCGAGVPLYESNKEIHLCSKWFNDFTGADISKDIYVLVEGIPHESGHAFTGKGHAVCSQGNNKGKNICDKELRDKAFAFEGGATNFEFYFLAMLHKHFNLPSTIKGAVSSMLADDLANFFNTQSSKDLSYYLNQL